jgi:bacillithiol biosynthesis cysteine-adding enzyme BshC
MQDPFSAYVADAPDLLDFFAGPPRQLWQTGPACGHWDAALVAALCGYQSRLGGSAACTGEEAAIITGQQPGLFTGPLYTIYKAVTVVLLALRLEQRFGVPCAPVFWVAGDDHDFDEVRRIHLLTKQDEPLLLEYTPKKPVEGLPLHRIPAGQSLHEVIDRAQSHARGSEFRGEVAAFLHESLEASESLAEWAERILVRLFRDTPLLVFSPALPEARVLAGEVIEKDILHPLECTRRLNEAGARLESLGYRRQLAKRDTECNFFLDEAGRRCKVVFEKGLYRMPDTGHAYSVEALGALARAEPERFSPNVALRCVVQQRLFPVAAYVGGPGEIAYWAQLKPVFEFFGLPMPVVYPRIRCTLTTTKLRKIMTGLGLTLNDLAGNPEDVVARALQATSSSGAYAVAKAHATMIERDLEALREGLGGHDKQAAALAEQLGRRVGRELERLKRSILMRDEAHVEATRRQVGRLCNVMAPWRKPQERVYTVFSFLFEQGWGLVARLLEKLEVESFAIQEIEL